jgi:uncharacterized protein YbjT (DUF2867 family)
MEKRIILVVGATGAQGGSVAYALLKQGVYDVRIMTRDTSSAKAIALERAGAEVVYGDLDKIETLSEAMQDCYGVFGITNFWEHFGKEFFQGRNLLDAAKAAKISHLVLHTLPDYQKLSGGKFPTPHCDLKAALQRYAISLCLPATFIHTAFYYENFIHFFPLKPMPDGAYHFGFPQGDTRLAMVSVEDVGGIVAKVFLYPKEYIGRVVGAVGAHDTCAAYAEIMTRVLGEKVVYDYIPYEQYAALNFPGADELANMFETQRLFIKDRTIDLIESYGLNPAMQTFESWVLNHRTQLLALMREAVGVAV